jgi:hypothetical protein
VSVELRKPRSRTVRRGWKITPSWSPLTAEAEQAMPEGTRLAVLLGGVSVPVVKTSDGRWRVETRGGVQADRLVGRPVAARVPRGGQ